MDKKRFWQGITSVGILLLVFCVVATSLAFTRAGDVNLALGVIAPRADITEDTNYFPSDYSSKEAAQNTAREHVIQTQIEGSVLLKNNGALPLMGSERKITLFGKAASDSVFHGGSGGPPNTGTTLYDAMKAEGFNINDAVFNKIKAAPLKRTKTGFIGEVSSSVYSGTESSFAEYSDAAIIVLCRYGGEEGELFHGLDGNYGEGPSVPQLRLQNDEKDLLNLVKNSGTFRKTIVLVNSGYAMELGWLDEYGVDACLWIGYPGSTGMTGVAKMLAGNADPSGRLADTHAADSLSSAAIQNAGDFTFSNLSVLYKNKYLIYAEGIYVGYKYYETRYQDQVLGINNASSAKGKFASAGSTWNYADEMTFTFGSGMSYASFTQELISVEWDKTAHTVTSKVKVKNNGNPNYGGKSRDVVQLYVQAPYIPGGAEKSAIQLIDFAKTKELSSGEEEIVELVTSDYLFASYDTESVNGAATDKKGCYVLDAGNYYFAIGDNAHSALNNVLAKRGVSGLFDETGAAVSGETDKVAEINLAEKDNTTYAKSRFTEKVVSNQFEDRDINHFIPGTVTYMTRSDWRTFPSRIINVEANAEIKDLMENAQYKKPTDAPAVTSYKYRVDSGIKFIEMKGVGFDDSKWETFIDQLSISELCQIVGDKMGMDKIDSISFPAYSGGDGPDGYQAGGVLYNSEVLAASTFDKQALSDRGKFIAEESYWIGFKHIYGPGANHHRTPYSGRNFEYYSEDSILSFHCGYAQTKAMSEKGCVTTVKHFCGNDQEVNRHGVATFLTEQTYREVTLKCFEGALSDAKSLATMTAFNRIGCVPSAADYPTMTTVLREEWNFRGINMTDSSKDSATYMSTADCLYAGTTQFNNDPGRVSEANGLVVKDKDGFILGKLRETAHYYLYAMVNSNHINGLSLETVVTGFIPWWMPAMIIFDCVLGVLVLLSAVLFVKNSYFVKKEAV